MNRVVLYLLLPSHLVAGTISLGPGSISVFGGDSDNTTPPAFVTNSSAFGFVLTDGVTTAGGQQRRNTDPSGGPNTALAAVATFDGRQTTITGTITALSVADSEGNSGARSQAFAIGLCTGGWRDQAAATYNLNLLASQPGPATDGFSGIAFGFRNGSLYLAGYDYDSQPEQIVYDLGQAGLASGQSITAPLSFTLVYAQNTLMVSLNGQSLGSIPTSHDFSSALLIAMGGSVDPANGIGTLTFSNLTASTPSIPGAPALAYRVLGDQQAAAAGAALPQPMVVGVVDSYRNPLTGVLVSFAAGDATVSPATAATDSSGQASANVTLGNAPGAANVIASVAALPLLTFQFTVLAGSQTPQIAAVVNGASFGTTISSGGWATILGANLAGSTAIASMSGTALPTALDGVSVSIDGLPAFVYYVSPAQINVIVPDDQANGGVSVQVTSQGVTSNIVTADKEDFGPSLFLFTSRYPAAAHNNGVYVGPPNLLSGMVTEPATPGEVILLFGTGFGPLDPPVAAGQLITNAAPPAQLVTATVGGVPANVQGYLVYPGMYQFNLTVPQLPAGDAALELSVAGRSTQSGVMLSIGP
ncbi:MAG TPA: hypothetical protein VLW25_11335 [Bryobacteraceae bacterium]|nr:hypothetical protein [Bryobacteraceae bacterium]